MVRYRIIYCLALAVALIFQISDDSYFAPILLAVTAALPAFSLLLSLPSILSCRLSLSSRAAVLPRGDEARWLVIPRIRLWLPLPRLRMQLEEENMLTGAKSALTLVFNGVTDNDICELRADSSHCGLLELRVKKLHVYDYLGLFTFPLPKPEAARILVSPVPRDPGPLYLPNNIDGRPAPGTSLRQSVGEDYDLREYRPGDPIRTVYWKLTAKWDKLIVRESAETIAPLPLLTFGRFGSPKRLDAVLDKLTGYSRAFLAVQRAHCIQWLDERGERVYCQVTDEKELQHCLLTIVSTPAPAKLSFFSPRRLAETDGPSLRIHISLGEGDELGI